MTTKRIYAPVPGFKSLGGTSNKYLNIATGETISRRQYDKLKRPGFTDESLAKLKKSIDEKAQLSRPARGRTSIKKIAPDVREDIAEIRKEFADSKAQAIKQTKAEKKLQSSIERQKNKKVRRKKIRKQLLKPGQSGTRIAFSDYEEYLEAMSEAKRIGNIVFGYALGWHGVDERDGLAKDVTVMTMTSFRDGPISEEEFEEMFSDSIEEKSYLIFLNYFMHVGFSKVFATDWAESHGKGKKKSAMDKFR